MCESIAAALADLDARMEDNRALIDALRRALADAPELERLRDDLDACRAALAPVAIHIRRQDKMPHGNWEIERYIVRLTRTEATRIVAVGEDP